MSGSGSMTMREGREGRPVALVVSTGEAIGDALTRIPCYRALREALPDHRIINFCKKSSSLLEPLRAIAGELVDEVHYNQPLGGPFKLRQLVRSIGNVDVIVDLRSNFGAVWTYLATAGMPIRYVANVAMFGLRHGVPLLPEPRPVANSYRFHRLAELLAGRQLAFDPLVDVRDDARERAADLIGEGTRFVVLAPGSSASSKAWPASDWVRLGAHLQRRGVLPVFLLGPPETLESRWILRDLPGAAVVDLSAAGKAEDLPWLFHALADRAIGAVTIEGGVGHLLASRGRPLLTISGPTNAKRWRPATPHHWSVAARDFGSRRTADVPYEAVLVATDEMIRFAETFPGNPGAAPHA